MSRIEQALKRRDKDSDRGEASTGLLGWRRWHDVETPIVPAWQLERFPVERTLDAPHDAPAVEPPVERVAAAAAQTAAVPVAVAPAAVAPVAVAPSAAAMPAAPPASVEPPTTPTRFRQFNRSVAGKLVGDRRMDRRAIEQYRRLAASLHQVQLERGTKRVMITSAVNGEGKTLTALNLALTLSTSYRRRVVLIDANLRSPSVHTLLDVSNVVGLNEALTESEQATPAFLEISPRLSIVPAGNPAPDPMGHLTSPRMAGILDEIAAKFDWVIIDTPPVVQLPDTNLLVNMVDAAIVIIEAGKTSYDVIERAVQVIGRQRVLGFVLNNIDSGQAGSA